MILQPLNRTSTDEPGFLQGNRARWRLLRLLGEGDAGEVYLVESFLDKKIAILKRPRRNSFPADILRQANQIDTEACILNALSYTRLASPDTHVRIANLLDQSLPGNELTERYFIVVEKAPGLDLETLQKLFRYGFQENNQELGVLDENGDLYLHKLSEIKTVPELLVLRVLLGLFDLLEIVHQHPVKQINADHHGILWNDIKLNHLFWDPVQGILTVIDWGNGQFLEADGVSADRLYSPADDFRQLVEVLGKFLAECAPQLHAALGWPAFITPADATKDKLVWLKEKIANLVEDKRKNLREARLLEVACISANPPDTTYLQNLEEVHRRIVAHGEMPDFEGAARLYARLAAILAGKGRWKEFRQACDRLANMPASQDGKWKVIAQIHAAADQERGKPTGLFIEALQACLKEDWTASLWSVCKATQMDPDGTRWQALSSAIRSIVLDPGLNTPTPFSAAIELLQSLEEDRPWIIERLAEAIASGNLSDPEKPEKLLKAFEALVARFKNHTLKKWLQPDPVPPGAGLAYDDVDSILAEMEDLLPRLGINPRERLAKLSTALAQPRAQTEIVIDAWHAKGTKTAQGGLRNLLLWDPDRRRVLRIDEILQDAPAWLEETRRGPQPGERLPEYSLRMEFQCREMRGRIASAHWIESALTLFSELRSGRKPGEILAENPRLSDIFLWLQRYERKAIPEPKTKEPPQASQPAEQRSRKLSRECLLGQGQAVFLAEALDAWVPEAKGSSARVFQGFLQDSAGQSRQAAVKIMRPDKADYAMPLFWEEVQVLSLLEDVPGVAKLLECGYFQLNGSPGQPVEDSLLAAHALTGKVIHFEPDEADLFLDGMQNNVSQGWLPYLAVEKKNKDDSLLLMCDEGYTRGKVIPVEHGLEIAVKICDILEIAHARDIVYRDHKILHYYWNSRLRKVSMIDWNVAKWYPQGASVTDIKLDLVQFGARTLHHILTGRPAPGALPVGPNQPYEIEMAPDRYSPAWTYDDSQRLPEEVMDLLTQVLSGSYESASRLREDLLLQLPYRKG